MANSSLPMFDTLESRTLMSASPLVNTAYTYAKEAYANWDDVYNVVTLAKMQLSSYGASSVHEILGEDLSAYQRAQANDAEAYLQGVETRYDKSEAKLENEMVKLRKEEATKYKKYNHTVFNQELNAFNAYDKGFYNELIEMETLM